MAWTTEQLARAEANRARAIQIQKDKAKAKKDEQNDVKPREPRKREQQTELPSTDAKKLRSTVPEPTSAVLKEVTNYSKNVQSKPVLDPLKDYKSQVTVKFELISPTEVQILFNPYVEEIKNLIKSYKTSKFNPEDKTWSFELKNYGSLVNAMKKLQNATCTVKELPLWIFRLFNTSIDGLKMQKTDPVENLMDGLQMERSLLKKMFPYQRQCLVFGLEKNGRILIADEMGLGKTIQALGIMRVYSAEWPLLIVCPASVKHAWKGQIKQFLPGVCKIITIDKSNDIIPKDKSTDQVLIMSYEQMNRRKKELLDHKDESHMLKNPDAQRTKAATELSAVAQRVLLLTGTPVLSRPAELFSQLKLIDPTIFPSWNAYAWRYCKPRKTKFGMTYDGNEHLRELSVILQRTMIRRMKKDVLSQLPPKRREILYIADNNMSAHLEALKKSRTAFEKSGDGTDAERDQKLSTYYADTGVAKADAVAEYIISKYFEDGNEEVGKKLLVFAHHTTVMDMLEIRFNQKKIKSVRIDGSTSGKLREAHCRNFQNDPRISIAVLSITAAGVGLTLTAADKVIFAELYWNPGSIFQAEDRVHRVGQKSSVLITYVLARNTADDRIWPKIQDKIMVSSGLKLNAEMLNNLNKETYEVPVEGQPKITDFFTILEQ